MPRIAYILLFVTCICCSGCMTHSQRVHAMIQRYGQVKPGMTRAQVYALEPAPTPGWSLLGLQESVTWQYGSLFADQEYVLFTVFFGKDDRVESTDIETGHGYSLRAKDGIIPN